MTILPTVFVSHGAPTLALNPGETGKALAYLGRALPRPKNILVISAHWDTEQPCVSSADKPGTIHDFHGFPAELYKLEYRAPGTPKLAQRVRHALETAGFTPQVSPDRGLDHGAWVPLRLMYPNADIPVTQLSVQSSKNADYHYLLGQALSSLRHEDVLIVGSGSFTHNLSEIGDYGIDAPVQPYVTEFGVWMMDRIQRGDIGALTLYRDQAPHAARAHPTEEHLLPLFVALGAAHGEKTLLHIDTGATYGVLSMDAFVFGADDVPVYRP